MPYDDQKNEGMYVTVKEKVLTPEEKTLKVIKSIPNKIFSSVQGIVIIFAFLVLLYLIFITPHQVDGVSMLPTYKDKEFLIANKIVYNLQDPQRGDVIIFKFSQTRDFIKRVVAVEGDTVSIRDGKFYVNGEYLNESQYLDASVYTDPGTFLKEGQVTTVPAGKVFVAGDNRPHSSDSRAFGPIEVSQIKGRVWFVFYPIKSFRLITRPAY